MVSLGHVASGGISSARRQNKESVLVDAHDSSLPKKGIGELHVDFANFDRVREMAMGWRGGNSRLVYRDGVNVFLLHWR